MCRKMRIMKGLTETPGKRVCACGCRASIEHKHKNAVFFNQRHKDKYWNRVNPRGMFARLNPDNTVSDEDDWKSPHRNFHPFSSEAMGQD